MHHPLCIEQRKMIVRVRDRFRYIDSLPEPQRTLAAYGVPEDEWPRYADWIARAMKAMKESR